MWRVTFRYEFPRFWDMYMSSDSSILTPGQLPDWQISKGFNRYERLKLLRCLWMHPTTLAELSLCAPWLIQLVLLVHHSTDVALWTDACEACQSGPLRSAQGAIGPVAHNHQGLLVRVLGIHQLMDIDGYWRSVMPMPKTASEYHLPLLICTIFNYL